MDEKIDLTTASFECPTCRAPVGILCPSLSPQWICTSRRILYEIALAKRRVEPHYKYSRTGKLLMGLYHTLIRDSYRDYANLVIPEKENHEKS